MKIPCSNCGRELNRIPSRAKYHRCYCNNKCQMSYEFRNGIRDRFKITKKAQEACRKKGLKRFRENPRTYISVRGYKMIYIPGIGDKKYHHYVWEQSGRTILEGFCLHHINGNKLDNRLKNLILLTHHDHHKLHDAERERDEFGRYT